MAGKDTEAQYKIRSERKSINQQSRPKPYSVPTDKGKQKVNDVRRTEKEALAEVSCYRCGEKGHMSKTCTGEAKRCYRCGRKGHIAVKCKHEGIVCFNCEEEGHISAQCEESRRVLAKGKVFVSVGTQTTEEDLLIGGTCLASSIPLITIIDYGVAYCLLMLLCFKLGFSASCMNGNGLLCSEPRMVVETPAKGSVTTSLVCLKCPLSMLVEFWRWFWYVCR